MASLATLATRLRPAVTTVSADLPLVKRLGVTRLSFVLSVLIPTVATILYLLLVRSPEYVSEARFVVRAGSEDILRRFSLDLSNASSLLSGMKNTSQDTHMVMAYMRSRNAIDDIGGRAVLERLYARGEIDYLSRLKPGETAEALDKYWRKKVSVVLDVPAGIVTLEVRAFRREDAIFLAERILLVGERLVNEVSERARGDTMQMARADLEKARHEVDLKRQALAAFRQKNEVLDPATTATNIGELITKILKEKLVLEGHLSTVRQTLREDSSTVRTLQLQIATLDQQIRKLETELTSSDPEQRAVATQMAGYEQAQLELKFAEKLYEITETSFRKAVSDVQRQQLYLVMLLRPTHPQDNSYPRPLLDGLLAFVWLSALWSVIALTIAGTVEHR
jgi:capsular polysaccharide transport system permease protein